MSIVTEAYRGLRSSLLLSQAGGAPQVMLVTSAVCGEGKTTNLINAAIIFAQMDIRVLIIDADLRRPHCHTFLKMQRTFGLAEHLAGQVELQKAIAPTRIANLSLMSSGSSPPNPAELLGSKKMQDTLQELRGEYQYILIDSSPVMAVSDALVLSTHTDGVLLVIDSRTPKQLVKKASTRLTTNHTKILGIILNGTDIRKRDFNGYYDHYYDYHQDAQAIAGLSPEDEQPQEFLELITTKLTEVMGPMAPLVLRDHIHRLGESADCFPEARREELIERVSSEIVAGSLRREFKDEIMKEIKAGSVRIYADGASTPHEPEMARPPSNDEQPQDFVQLNPEDFLQLICAKLSEALGPMALRVLDDHIRRLGESAECFPEVRREELIERVSSEIFADSLRREFKDEMMKEIKAGGARIYDSATATRKRQFAGAATRLKASEH